MGASASIGRAPWYPFAPAVVGVEPESATAAEWRLQILADTSALTIGGARDFIGGNSNDAWLFPETVLRICWRGDRDRFLREAAVLDALPEDFPKPTVLDAGRTDDLAWILTRRGPGVPLNQLDNLDEPTVRNIFRQQADALRALHAWVPPAPVAALLRAVDHDEPFESPCPKQVVPLAIDDVIRIAEAAALLPFVSRELIDSAIATLNSLRDVVPAPEQHDTVIHGDPAWGNLLVANGRLSALIDFEWVRFGPVDAELVVPVFLGFASPQARQLVAWLKADYPALFSGPDLHRRMWFFQLSFALRGVLWWPPDAPERELTPDHHLHNVRRLAAGPFFDLP